MELVLIIIQMEMFIKVLGKMIKKMDQELILINSQVNITLENGLTTKKMDQVKWILDMEIVMKVIFMKTIKMEKELFIIKVVLNLMDYGMMILSMDKV